jgi:UDP-4-amino-4,6-dideoxy-N-acetyl-beta-L-altrosamine transaminase
MRWFLFVEISVWPPAISERFGPSVNKPPFLPYGRQTIDEDDIAAVAEALRGAFLTTGPLVEDYESAFAEAVGAVHAVSCNSGTAALHLAVLAAGVGPGDAVVVPSITFLATANAARMAGAEVIFADVDSNSGLMTADTFGQALARAASSRVKLAIPVHLNGQFCDMQGLKKIADIHGVSLIEDACHALGAPSSGSAAHSRAACFSTHPVKAITTGEGGCVTTSDERLADKMRVLRSHGMTRVPDAFHNTSMAYDEGVPNPWYYEMTELGWNYRLPDILCSLGISQLRKLTSFWIRRRELAELYDRLLAPLAPIVRPVLRTSASHGWHLYAILADFAVLGISRARFMTALRELGIGSQVHYIPVHRQPYYRKLYGEMVLSGADAYYAQCLSLPIFPLMMDNDVHHVVNSINQIILDRKNA